MKNLQIVISFILISAHFQIVTSQETFISKCDQILKNRLPRNNRFGVIGDKKYKKEPATEIQFSIGGINALNEIPVTDRHGKLITQHINAIIDELARPDDDFSRYNNSQAIHCSHNYIERPLLAKTIELIAHYQHRSTINQTDTYVEELHQQHAHDICKKKSVIANHNNNSFSSISDDTKQIAEKENIKTNKNVTLHPDITKLQKNAQRTVPNFNKSKAKKYKQQKFTQTLRPILEVVKTTKK